MRSIQVTTDYAFTVLVDKLSQLPGVVLDDDDVVLHARAITIHYEDALIPQFAEALTNVLLNDWLFDVLYDELQQQHRELTEDEIEYLVLVLLHELKSGELVIGGRSFLDWRKRTATAFQNLLKCHDTLELSGFVRFRLRQFKYGLAGAVDERVQQFLLDREYDEFVAMLRYMLESQPESEQELHVFCSPERVWIMDSVGRLVRDTEVTEAAIAESEGEVNSEDLAMSILITRSPCRIVIHDTYPDAPWPSFPETLTRVFAERTVRCGHCSTCQQLEQARQHFPRGMEKENNLHNKQGPTRS